MTLRENFAQNYLAFKASLKKVCGSYLYQRSARQRAPKKVCTYMNSTSNTSSKLNRVLNMKLNLDPSIEYQNENQN